MKHSSRKTRKAKEFNQNGETKSKKYKCEWKVSAKNVKGQKCKQIKKNKYQKMQNKIRKEISKKLAIILT